MLDELLKRPIIPVIVIEDANDAEPDDGVVMHFRVNEQGMFHFMSLSASFVVRGGDKVDRCTNNYWFDPDTMEPLINQPGHVRALETLYELSQAGPPAQSAWDLGTAWDWFLRGKAIYVFSWGDVGSLVQDESRSKIKGKMGASVLPGSSEVYNVAVSGREDQMRFLDNIGGFGEKAAPAVRLRALLASKVANTNVDTLAREVFARVKTRMSELQISQRRMAAMRGRKYAATVSCTSRVSMVLQVP